MTLSLIVIGNLSVAQTVQFKSQYNDGLLWPYHLTVEQDTVSQYIFWLIAIKMKSLPKIFMQNNTLELSLAIY